MAFVSVEVSASTVIEAMNDDGDFLLDMWQEIASGLSAGMLLDNTMDAFADLSAADQRGIYANLEYLSKLMRERMAEAA